MKTKLEKEVKILKIYAISSTIVFVFLILVGFRTMNKNQKFEEIDVERINIVEQNGDLKMVISNKERQHPGIVNGKVIKRDYPRPPGIIFFNQMGDEMGGLVYGENGPDGHFGSFTWDKVRGDQTIGYRHLEGADGSYETGIQMWQQPNIPSEFSLAKIDSVMEISNKELRKEAFKKLREKNLITTRRLFLGKNRSDAAVLEMLDLQGNSRLALMVEPDGTPKLIFMDKEGNITYSLPEE
jgi:hypothetical protein